MRVKKRNGSLQPFDIDKVRLTLERVSDEIDSPLTGSDIRILTDAIEGTIQAMNKEIIESAKIYGIVIGKLKEFGFRRTALAYEKFSKRFKTG